MKRVLGIIRAVLFCVLGLILLINLYMIASRLVFKQTLPKVFGFSYATVISGSMEPAFSAGDMLVFRQYDSYGVNDIVIFSNASAYVTHRITGQSNGSFITKGDANNIEDEELLMPEEIEGKMILVIPAAGRILGFFKTPLGILLLVTAAFALIELPSLLDRRKGKRVKQ